MVKQARGPIIQAGVRIGLTLMFGGHAALVIGQPQDTAEACPSGESLTEWLEAASQNNILSQAKATELSARERDQDAAGLLPGPQFSVGRERASLPDFGDTPQSAWVYGLRQSLPWPGLLGAQDELAKAWSNQAKAALAQTKLGAQTTLLHLLITWSETSGNISIESENLTEAKNLAPLARSRYSQGRESHANLLDAEIDEDLSELRISRLKRQLQNIESEINYVARCRPVFLGHDLENKLEEFLNLETKPQEADPVFDSIEAQAQVRIATSRVARAKIMPSFNLGIMAGQMDSMSDPMIGWTVGFSLPLFSTGATGAYSEQEVLAASWSKLLNDDLSQARTRTLFQLSNRESELQAELSRLRESIRPRAREHLESLYSEFAQGRAPASDVIRSRRRVLEIGRAENMLLHELLRTKLSKYEAEFLAPTSFVPLPELGVRR